MPAAIPEYVAAWHIECSCGPQGGKRKYCRAPAGAVHRGTIANGNLQPPPNPGANPPANPGANPPNPGGAGANANPVVAPLGPICNRDFGQITDATMKIIVKDGDCLRCKHPVAAHDITVPASHPPAPTHIHQAPEGTAAGRPPEPLTAAATPAAPDTVRTGPLVAPIDESALFLRDMDVWRLDPVLDTDRKGRDTAMSTIVDVMFDGSPACMKHVYIMGPPSLDRTYNLKPILAADRNTAGLQFRRLVEMGKAILYRYKSKYKYDYVMKAGVDKDRQLVARVEYELPADTMALECIIANGNTKPRLGQVLPQRKDFTNEHPLYFGLAAASTPVDDWISTMDDLISDACATWRKANTALTTDRVTWKTKFSKAATDKASRPITIQVSGQKRQADTPRDGGQGRGGGDGLSKAARRRMNQKTSAGASTYDDGYHDTADRDGPSTLPTDATPSVGDGVRGPSAYSWHDGHKDGAGRGYFRGGGGGAGRGGGRGGRTRGRGRGG
jgi:hypothetical protein